jgi:hypothetical protein
MKMRVHAVLLGLGSLLFAMGPAAAQTPEIQKQIEQKLEEMRKDRTALQDLLAQALKNNADIRVAEAKVREAEAELYRTRMAILNKIAMLQQQIRSRKAEVDEATSRYEREKILFNKGGSSAAEVSAAAAAVMKYKADLAVVEAELDGLVGKHAEKTGEWKRLFDMGVAPVNKDHVPFKLKDPKEPPPLPTAVAPALADKLRKALNSPAKFGTVGQIKGDEVIDLLREFTKGINIHTMVEANRFSANLDLRESVPVGAFYQWAEDQFAWRFIVRDYGIVATEREKMPPGAVLLLDFWRKGEPPAASGK